MLEAPELVREGAAAVHQQHPQVGMAVEHAADGEPAAGHEGLQRVADDVGQVEALGVGPGLGDHREVGVQHHRRPELGGGREEDVQVRRVELPGAHAGPDLDPDQAQLLARPPQLLGGGGRIVHRHGRHRVDAPVACAAILAAASFRTC